MKPLKIGCAYHSNRIFSHVRDDMDELVNYGFNSVVHTLSHNDMVRCPSVMKDIFSYTKDIGLELWVDNWGLMGSPGDPSHFLSYHPEAARYFSDGSLNSPKVCLNSEAFVRWTKEWIDKVYECGGRKIFWDEPHLTIEESRFACACPTCKKLFKEKYGREMPVIPDDECRDFQIWTIVNYFDQVTEYSHSKGMINSVCVMLAGKHGINLDNIDALGKLRFMDNIGSDPYWKYEMRKDDDAFVYKFVYENSLKNLKACEAVGKDHNIWIKAYGLHENTERDSVYAAEAAYDAGARNIFFWGYRGCDGNEYRSMKPRLQWAAVREATARLWEKEREYIVNKARKELGLK